MAIMRRGNGTNLQRSREWDPFQTMREIMGWDPLHDITPRLRSNEDLAFMPAFDVRETKDAYVFLADLPGFRDEDVDVDVNGRRLTITGRREAENVDASDDYDCCERSHGSFTRAFTLPDGVDVDRIHAELKNGMLSINVPKSVAAQPRRIALRSGEGAQGSAPATERTGKMKGQA